MKGVEGGFGRYSGLSVHTSTRTRSKGTTKTLGTCFSEYQKSRETGRLPSRSVPAKSCSPSDSRAHR
eukprot:7575802-Pyramimonas_sp.AAC.1